MKMKICRNLVIAVFLMFTGHAVLAKADEETPVPDHVAPGQMAVDHFLVCKDAETAATIIVADKNHGIEVASAMVKSLVQQGSCVAGNFMVTVVGAYMTATGQDGAPLVVLKVLLHSPMEDGPVMETWLPVRGIIFDGDNTDTKGTI